MPLDNMLSDVKEGQGSTDEGIDIVIGSQGGNRTLSLDLGDGVLQHVLIAGKIRSLQYGEFCGCHSFAFGIRVSGC